MKPGLDLPAEVRALFPVRGRGRRRLLWITYEFDRRTALQRLGDLHRRGVRVDVLAGRDTGVGEVRLPGIRAWRAHWRGTFHPKLVVALDGARVVAGLGSANLTAQGLGGNLEAWTFLEGTQHRDALRGIRAFLEGLVRERIASKGLDLGEFIAALPRGRPSGETVAASIERPLAGWLEARVPRNCGLVEVVSPVHGDPRAVVRWLRRISGARRVVLHTGPEGRSLPRMEGVDEVRVLEARGEDPAGADGGEAAPEEGAEGPAGRRVPVHAKLLAFHHGSTVGVAWGSANLSAAAWRREGRGRNLELATWTVLSAGAWRRFLAMPREGCTWVTVRPAADGVFPEAERDAGGWSLLQGRWEGHSLVLEASDGVPGRASLRLRRGGRGRGVLTTIAFKDGEATVPPAAVNRLGLELGATALLHWREGRREWQPLEVHGETIVDGPGADADILELLGWEFGGRTPQTVATDAARAGAASGTEGAEEGGEDVLPEEIELRDCAWHGALDERALRVRALARRVAVSCSGNRDLWGVRRDEVLRRAVGAGAAGGRPWTKADAEFLSAELERAWRE